MGRHMDVLTSPDRASKLLNWGEVGYAQIHRAVEILGHEFGIKLKSVVEQYV